MQHIVSIFDPTKEGELIKELSKHMQIKNTTHVKSMGELDF